MDIKEGVSYTIMGYACGRKAAHKFNTMGLNVGRVLKVKVSQPLEGPYVIEINNHKLTIGRGLFDKLLLEEFDEES